MQQYFSAEIKVRVDENDPARILPATYSGTLDGEIKVNELTKNFFELEIYASTVTSLNSQGLGPVFWGDSQKQLGYIPYAFTFPAGTQVSLDDVVFKPMWQYRDSFDRVISGKFIVDAANKLDGSNAQSCYNYNKSSRVFSFRLSESGWTVQDCYNKYFLTKGDEDRL